MTFSAELTIAQQQAVSDFIHQRFGLFFSPPRFADMVRALDKATEETGLDNIAAYVRWLLSQQLSDKQLEPLITNLTIGETYFFRDSALFSGLERVVFPEIVQRGTKQVRIWSAACSTGEEAYSLAMLLDQVGSFPDGWQVDLYATDVNVKSLAKARAAIYSQWSFRGMDEAMKGRYFSPCGKHHWQLAESMRTKVQFSYLNLAQFPLIVGTGGTHPFDVILCRNVLMYFSPERRAEILQKLTDMLSNNGWLVVSPSEVGLVNVEQLRVVDVNGMLMHRKMGQVSKSSAKRRVGSHNSLHNSPVLCQRNKPRVTCIVPQATTPSAAMKTKLSPSVVVSDKSITASPYDGLADAWLLVKQKDYRVAIKLLLALLAEDQSLQSGTQVETLLLLARCFANVGEVAEAQQWLEKALQLDRLNASAHYLLAIIYQEQGELDQVRKSLDQALYLDPDFIMATFSLGLLLHQGDEKEQGDKLLQRVLTLLSNMEGDTIIPESEGLSVSYLSQMVANLA
ncbi:MAG: CheR family methyltransferase [Thermodesulfobacteriota bacterium]|nr:CheR family methyltransferase [Thermodesulfobacteriota bacterium]